MNEKLQAANEFLEKKMPRYGFLPHSMRIAIHKELMKPEGDRELEEEHVKRIGKVFAALSKEKHAGVVAKLKENDAARRSGKITLTQALFEFLPHRSKKSYRRELAAALKKGRAIERRGHWQLGRGYRDYNEWLGVDLVEEANKLAAVHGPIRAADVGGGVGYAIASLKKAVGHNMKEAQVTSLVPHEKIDSRNAPITHVAHVEKLPFPSGTVHLLTSVRGATWYTGKTLHRSVAEIARTLHPGGKAFLHVHELSRNMQEKLNAVFRKEGIDAKYKYGVGGTRYHRQPGETDTIIHVSDNPVERDEKARELREKQVELNLTVVDRYRVLCLTKRP